MSKHSRKVPTSQQSFLDLIPFASNETAAKVAIPAPLQTAEKFDFPLQHYAPTDNKQEYLYSIQDWIAGLTDGNTLKAGNLWQKMKNETVISIHALNYTASDNKTYTRDFTNAKGLYLISQNLRATKARPQLKEVREFLATSAAWVELIGRNETAAKVAIKGIAKYHGLRADSVIERKNFTATIKNKSLRFNPKVIGMATNLMYARLFRIGTEWTAKKEICAVLGLSTSQARNFRDNINELALSAVVMAEKAAIAKMDNTPKQMTDTEILYTVKQCARIAAVSAHDLAAFAGVDLLTGKPILPSGKDRARNEKNVI